MNGSSIDAIHTFFLAIFFISIVLWLFIFAMIVRGNRDHKYTVKRPMGSNPGPPDNPRPAAPPPPPSPRPRIDHRKFYIKGYQPKHGSGLDNPPGSE